MISFMKSDEYNQEVIRTKMIFNKFLMEKNLPLAIADVAEDLFCALFLNVRKLVNINVPGPRQHSLYIFWLIINTK